MRIGELVRELDKAQPTYSGVQLPEAGKLKSEAIADAGLSRTQAYRYQELAGPREANLQSAGKAVALFPSLGRRLMPRGQPEPRELDKAQREGPAGEDLASQPWEAKIQRHREAAGKSVPALGRIQHPRRYPSQWREE